MKCITETQYDQLCKTCDNIINNKPNSFERNANSFLHVIREHPIFLNPYKPIFYNNNFKFYFFILTQLFKSFIVGILKFFDAIYRIYFLRDIINRDKTEYQNIFITHFLNEKFLKHKNDFYFHELPKKFINSQKSSLKLYINFTNLSSSDAEKKWLNNDVPSILIPKYLPIYLELKLRFLMFTEAISILKIKSFSSFDMRVKIYAAVASLFSSSHNNYRLAFIVRSFVKKNTNASIFTTYEGHPWERLIFGMVRKINSKINCIGYQHAIIFRKQHSIRRKLSNIFEPNYIMCSGEHGFKELNKINYLPSRRLFILGSNRRNYKKLSRLAVQSKNRDTFLLLPEGDLVECIPMANFTLNLALKFPKFKFIIRFHPVTKVKKVIKKYPQILQGLPNIEISNLSFEEDLLRSHFAIYRGSTTIIKAVEYGLIPLYYKRPDEISIDPLFEIKSQKINISYPEDLQILDKISDNEHIYNQSKLIEYVQHFFSPINYDVVSKLKDAQ